jgi:hypothetical protein
LNFRVLGFFDVWPLSASLRLRMDWFKTEAVIEILKHPDLEKWSHMRNVLSRIRRNSAGHEMTAAYIELLESGVGDAWDAPPRMPDFQKVILPIVTNPLAIMYSGPEQMHIAQGLLTWVNNAVLCSAVNHGATPRIHLVLEMRTPDALQERDG